MRVSMGRMAILGALALCGGAGCRRAAPTASVPHVVAASSASLPETPGDPAWNAAPEHVAPLRAQDQVEPRLLHPSTPEVRVRALCDGRRLAFRLEWADGTADDRVGTASFADACAVQMPRVVRSTIPAPQMGEPGHEVEIVIWSAAWQATVDGRGDSIRDIHPHAAVDHYPFESPALESGSAQQRAMEARYAPARALGNAMAGPREAPVQDLIASGPGTLAPVAPVRSRGAGRRTAEGWSVVIARELPEGLLAHGGSQAAFAVWEGGRGEVGSRKMHTFWIPLKVEVQP